jgi:uncharacterized membrane protein
MNNRSKEEKILISALIIALVVTIIILFTPLKWVGGVTSPLLGIIPYYVIPILIMLYLIAVAKRNLNSMTAESKTTMDIHAKIALLNESIDRIEKKLDKIESILEKVSE